MLTSKYTTLALLFYQLYWVAVINCQSCVPSSPRFSPSVKSDTQTVPDFTTSLQAVLPDSQFNCSGLLKEALIQTTAASEFKLQVWRPIDNGLYSRLWEEKYDPTVKTEMFRRIKSNQLQWSSDIGVPIQPGDVFGVHILKTDVALDLLHSTLTPLTSFYYVYSSESLCSISLCDHRVRLVKNIAPIISVTQFEKTSNHTQAKTYLSKMRVPCHKASFSSCPNNKRTKRDGIPDQSNIHSTPCPTPIPEATLPPNNNATLMDTNSPSPPGLVIKISPEAIAFIVVGIFLLVILVALVFVLVFCLRRKGGVRMDHTKIGPGMSDIASVDNRLSTGTHFISTTHTEQNGNEAGGIRHHLPQRSASHHYINGEVSHRGIFSSFSPQYVNTSSPPLTRNKSTSHKHLRNERVLSASILHSTRLLPHSNTNSPHRSRSVGPSTRLCTGIQPPPVPPRGKSRSRGSAAVDTHCYSYLEASGDYNAPLPPQRKRRTQSCVGQMGARVNREITSHDYAEPDTTEVESLVQSLKYDKLLPLNGSPQFESSGDSSLVPGPRERGSLAVSEDHSYSDPDYMMEGSLKGSSNYNYAYVPTEDQRRVMNMDHYEMQDDFRRDSGVAYDHLKFFEERETYWAPATTESGLYTQLYENKYRELPRNEIRVIRQIGSGHFGTVSMGVWESAVNSEPVDVAIKTVKACNELERIKLLQEAAIMGQFAHSNVVRLLGVVTVGEPALVVLEYMTKGDLRSLLQKLHPRVSKREVPDVVPKLFIKFSKDIANGMSYLSKKNFLHRDLAARNILLNNDLTCKIGDFGMARDVENDYYKSHGGIIPVKWTAPEALNYNKFSSASDVWSYGMVLFEIWSLGEKPFSELTNPIVIALVSSKHCQAPPPGCPRAIYHLMVECWNPEAGKRPTFDSIYSYLDSPVENLTYWHPSDVIADRRAHILGAPLREANNLYLQLQRTYQNPLIGNTS